MTVNLPEPVASYFVGANARDADGVAASFAEDGIVHDEGGVHGGRAAIRVWAEEAGRKYRFHAEVLRIAESGDQTIVTARVSGNFPGSPIDLTHRFKLANGLIAELEIG
jgi:ketosteroid isomerase-like protein